MASESDSRRVRAFQRRLERAGKVVGLSDHLEHSERLEALRMARAVAIAGLPKRRHPLRDLSRTLRLGRNVWLRVTYSASDGGELPFGSDRFVLAGIQHLAIEQNSPIVLFDRVGTLLKKFGLSEGGHTIALLRQRFKRISRLSVSFVFAENEEKLDEELYGEQIFLVRKYSLPSQRDLRSETAGQLTLPGAHPYGVILSDDFWKHLSDPKNRLLVPLELLKLFLDKPTGWDYCCFLCARCGAAQRASKVPHEALISLFRDTESQSDRQIIYKLRHYHKEIVHAVGGRLNAELVQDGYFPTLKPGRPKKRWSLIVRPSQSLFSPTQKLIEI